MMVYLPVFILEMITPPIGYGLSTMSTSSHPNEGAYPTPS